MKHIVFDIDGTLINTAYANLCSLRDAVRTFTGVDHTHEELTFSLGRSGVDTMRILNIPPEQYEAVIGLWEQNLLNYADTVHYFPGIPEVVELLHKKGHPMGIVTSKSKAEFDNEVILKNILHCFSIVVCAEDTEKHKPNPDPLLKYAELAGASVDDIIYIGDSPYDKACALSAGARFILAPWGSSQPVEVADDCRAQSPSHIPDLI